jgi:CheY-like chemotaxis protein
MCALKLLIAEDNDRMRQLLRAMCAGPDDQVIECVNGIETVAAYDLHQPDCVLMDLNMPELDGFGAMKSIKTRHPNARIVVVSELPESEYGESARQAGAADYVNKEELLRLPGILRSGNKTM